MKDLPLTLDPLHGAHRVPDLQLYLADVQRLLDGPGAEMLIDAYLRPGPLPKYTAILLAFTVAPTLPPVWLTLHPYADQPSVDVSMGDEPGAQCWTTTLDDLQNLDLITLRLLAIDGLRRALYIAADETPGAEMSVDERWSAWQNQRISPHPYSAQRELAARKLADYL